MIQDEEGKNPLDMLTPNWKTIGNISRELTAIFAVK